MTQEDPTPESPGITRVIIESPYDADDQEHIDHNIKYAEICLLDSLDRGETPFASHLLYTRVLDDKVPDDRRRGIQAGIIWMAVADLVAVYMDMGITRGMKYGIEQASQLGIRVEFREIPDWDAF
jgi:hypothetical protein